MTNSTKESIKKLLLNIVTDTIMRTKANLLGDRKPFHKALLDNEVIKLSSFERSFSTSFGQKYVEEISRLIVEGTGISCYRQHLLKVSIFQGAADQIDTIMAYLKTNRTRPDWNRELADIAAHDKGRTIVRDVISDLYFERNGIKHYFSIKTVKPNLDQTSIAKRDMLYIKAHNPLNEPYFALYYNPTGEGQDEYNYSQPFKYFNMKHDSCVLIGKTYWDFLGGLGTYEELLKIFNEVGQITIDQVKSMKL
ncbi:Type II restriction endonuclease, TdeIII [Cyclobacterium lianum]|uniref:type II site-specific deoxyribonuclease n=1 Tax=Cyclobacterium lianum TaxID=388280 RepID=A0A1M7M411_9BACT|nr:TdeIII family type II restriction endonuclease [Cyclobacterium lianum]SHM85373.1 Type II restriction endonuclease, TdeIII [Cyclobacterium lianum]